MITSYQYRVFKEQALCFISQALAKAGQFDKALDVTEMILSEWYKKQALSDISLVLAKLGHKERALSIAEKICDEETKNEALRNISESSALSRLHLGESKCHP